MPMQQCGKPASSTDPNTWTDFDTAVDAAPNYTGIGFVFSPDDPYCGIDFDGCRDPHTKEIAEWAKNWIKRFDSYAEVSPSMTGVKVWIEGKLPFESGKKMPVKAEPMGGKEAAVEAYDHARYFAVTGFKLAGMPEEPQKRQEQLEAFCKEYFVETEARRIDRESSRLSVVERARKYLDRIPGAISGSGGHNQTFKTACILVLGFSLTKTEALILLSEWNQRCEPKWTEKDLRHKVDSADKQPGERGYLRDTREENWGSTKVPDYKEPPKDPTPESKPSNAPRITTLLRATEEFLKTVISDKPNLMQMGLADVDKSLGGGVASGEMVLISARPGHGKSALGLQWLDYTAKKGIPCGIISEEMSHLALGERTVLFGSDIPKTEWKERHGELCRTFAMHFAERADCHIVEDCRTATKAAEMITELAETKGVKMFAVDYAQLLSSPGKSRYEQITQTSITLHQVAKKTNVTLLVMCQLSRAIESREKFVPHLEDLKDTGQLEQDADVVLFLVWPHRIDPANPENKYQIWIGKNRMRGILYPTVECSFDPERQRIALAEYATLEDSATVYRGHFAKSRRKKENWYEESGQ